MKIKLDQCTCKGIKISLTEEANYDINSKQKISTISSKNSIYGVGYSDQCGTCIEYCARFYGEQKEEKDSSSHQC